MRGKKAEKDRLLRETALRFYEEALLPNDVLRRKCQDREVFQATYESWKVAELAAGRRVAGGAGSILFKLSRSLKIIKLTNGKVVTFVRHPVEQDDQNDQCEKGKQLSATLKIPCVFFENGGKCSNGNVCRFSHGPEDPRFASNEAILAKWSEKVRRAEEVRNAGEEDGVESEQTAPWDGSRPGCTPAHRYVCEVSASDSRGVVAAALRELRDSGVDLCEKNEAMRSPAEYAGAHGKSNVLRVLHTDFGIDVGFAALGAACYGAVEALRTLHELGYDLSASPNSDTKFSGATVATEVGNVSVLRALVELGVDIPALDKDNLFGFIYDAAANNHSELIRFLVEAGCHIDRSNGQCESTAVAMAAQEGAMEALVTLIELGCDVSKPNASLITPLCIAETLGNLEAAELISAAGGNRCGQGQDCAICSGGRQQLMQMGVGVVCCAGRTFE